MIVTDGQVTGSIHVGRLRELVDAGEVDPAHLEPAVRALLDPPAELDEHQAADDGAEFDPAGHPVDVVLEHVRRHPDQAAAVLEAERAGKDRKSIVDKLGED